MVLTKAIQVNFTSLLLQTGTFNFSSIDQFYYPSLAHCFPLHKLPVVQSQ